MSDPSAQPTDPAGPAEQASAAERDPADPAAHTPAADAAPAAGRVPADQRDLAGRTVLLAGATGYLGRFVARELLARGAAVRALVRPGVSTRAENPGPRLSPALVATPGIPGTLTLVEADVTVDGALDGVCHGADAVLSTLGATSQKGDPFDIDFRANLALLRDAENAHRAGAAPLRTFQYVDALGSATSAAGVQRAKFAFTEVLLRSPIPAQIVASTGFFSDMSEMFDMVHRRVAPRIGDGGHRINPIHGADLAVFLADRLGGNGAGRWAVGGPETFTWQEIAALAATVQGTQPYRIGVPERALGPASWVADRIGPRTGSLTRMLAESMTRDVLAPGFGAHRLEEHFRALSSER